MKKQDLKTGMIVVTRRGEKGLIVLNNVYGEDAVIFSDKSWTGLSGFDDNTLEWHLDSRCGATLDHCMSVDIMEVYIPDLPTGFIKKESKFGEMDLVWERKEDVIIPEYTMEELTEKMGFEFKIKK